MNAQLNELLARARKEGEVFLCSLSGRQLRNRGFGTLWAPEEEFWKSIKYVNIYLLYDGYKFMVKYEFNGDASNTHYDYYSEKDALELEILKSVLEDYLG